MPDRDDDGPEVVEEPVASSVDYWPLFQDLDPQLVRPDPVRPGWETATIGAQFPALATIADLPLGSRAFRVEPAHPGDHLTHAWIRRTGASKIAGLLGLRRGDFLSINSFGPAKVARIFDYLARVAETAPELRALSQQPEVAAADVSIDLPDGRDVDRSALPGEQLETVLHWAVHVGGAETFEDLVRLVDDPLPADVGAAVRELLATRLPRRSGESPFAVVLEGDPRIAAVLTQRVASDDPRKLQDLADEFGVSRERVRQLETRALLSLHEAFESEPSWRSVRWAAERLRSAAGSFAPGSVLEEALPTWGPVERSLIALLAGFGRTRPDLVFAGFSLPDPRTLPQVTDTEYVVDEFELIDRLEGCGVLPPYLDHAIESIGSLARVDGQLVLWHGSIVDKAVAVMEVRDEPQDLDQIFASVTGGPATRSERNRVFEDPRLMRVTKNKVGLRRWGGSMYTGIAELMRERLGSGPMELDELAEELALRYEVSAASVRMFGAAPIFKVTGETIALRSPRDPFVPRDRPATVRGLYRDRSSRLTVWCLTVDHDLLRGSGRSIPQEIATDLGVAPGTGVELTTPVGPIPVSWNETSNSGPHIGSLRELVGLLGAANGQQVILRFDCDPAKLEVVAMPSAGGRAAPAQEIAARTSLPVALTQTTTALASTLDVSVNGLVAALESRGDIDIARLAAALESGRGTVVGARHLSTAAPPTTPNDQPALTPVPTHREDRPIGGSPIELKNDTAAYDRRIAQVLKSMAELDYAPKALRALVSAVGAELATTLLVATPDPGEAFLVLYRLGRLDLAIEAQVFQPSATGLFQPQVVDAARRRLKEHGFDPERQTR